MPDISFLVDARRLDELAGRTGDTYVWHMKPGSAYGESAILAARMDEGKINPQARLAHGVLGLIHVLRTAFALKPEVPILGVRDVRYSVPIFEGARLSVTITELDGETAEFAVNTDQLEPALAISGKLLYGSGPGDYDADTFASRSEQQLFTLEEAIGVVSALLGLGVQESGGRVLYMSQSLRLQGLVSLGDTLEAVGEVVNREPGRRVGEKVTVRVVVTSARAGTTVASGESLILYSEGSL